MNRFISVVIFLICISFNGFAQSVYKIPEDVKRVLFIGNSITYSGQYISYIEAYLTLRYPNRHFEFINVGLPSETVSGLSEPNHAGGEFPRPDLRERLERVLTKLQPDLVFSCYGMNDGIYMPFDEIRFQKFKEGIHRMHEKVVSSGALIIHLTPPIYDERKGKEYADVLDIYSDWLLSCKTSEKWRVIDIHTPMKIYLKERRLLEDTFAYAKDGVHPNEIGHWIMAKQVLLSLGEHSLFNVYDVREVFSSFKNGDSILEIVEERQSIMKKAWLTHTGFKRPRMKKGLPLDEAQQKSKALEKQIRFLLD